jgi:hypothetical protein
MSYIVASPGLTSVTKALPIVAAYDHKLGSVNSYYVFSQSKAKWYLLRAGTALHKSVQQIPRDTTPLAQDGNELIPPMLIGGEGVDSSDVLTWLHNHLSLDGYLSYMPRRPEEWLPIKWSIDEKHDYAEFSLFRHGEQGHVNLFGPPPKQQLLSYSRFLTEALLFGFSKDMIETDMRRQGAGVYPTVGEDHIRINAMGMSYIRSLIANRYARYAATVGKILEDNVNGVPDTDRLIMSFVGRPSI